MLLRILLYVFVFFAVSMPPATFASENPGSGVIINGRQLTAQQVSAIGRLYKFVPRPGRYWYDTVSGAWGLEGHELQGFILTGHNFGPIAANASAGNTGVFFNGREINLTEALRIQQTFGAVYRGRFWFDGRTGYYGIEGNPIPLGNVVAALKAQSGGGDNFSCNSTACSNGDGSFSYVNFGGKTGTVTFDH